jgi:hypothetical protein
MKRLFSLLIFISMFSGMHLLAKRVDIAPSEALYLINAPEEICQLVESVDLAINFGQNYEVAMPTKAGIEINPWNSFISSTINPQTKNLLFIIQPDFFNRCNKDEQKFLITRTYLLVKDGIRPNWLTIFIIIFSLSLSIALSIAIMRILKTRGYSQQQTLIITIGLMFLLEITLVKKAKVNLETFILVRNVRLLHIKAQKLSGITNADSTSKCISRLLTSEV